MYTQLAKRAGAMEALSGTDEPRDSIQEDSQEEALLTPDAALNNAQQAAMPAEVQDQQLVATAASAGAQIERGDLESTWASTTDTGGGGGGEEEGQHGGMEGCIGEEANQAQSLLLGTPSDKQGEVEVEHQGGEAGDGDEGSGVPLPLSEGDRDTGHAGQSTRGGEEGEEDKAADDKGNEGGGRGSKAGAGRQAAAMGEEAGTAAGKEAGEAAAGEEVGKASAGEEAGEAAAGEEVGEASAGEEAGEAAAGEEAGEAAAAGEASTAAAGEEGLQQHDETGGVAAETDADVPGRVAVCADLAGVPGDPEEGSVTVPLAGAAPAEVEEVEGHALPHSMTQDDTAPTARQAAGVPEAAVATTSETSLLGDVEAAFEALGAATAAEGAVEAGVSVKEVEGAPAEEAAPAAAEEATAVAASDTEAPQAAAAEGVAEAVEAGAGGGAAAGTAEAPAAQAGSAGVEGEDGVVGAGAELAALAAQVPGLLVVSGPSGVGKGTLIARLMALHPHRFGFCTSHTTRGPRPGEVDGQHYHFTTQAAMQSEIARGAFLEHASVHGNTYGTSLAAVAAVCSLGKLPLLDIDVQGARKVRSSVVGGRAASVFVAPPSLPELEARLRGRATESEDRIKARLSAAAAEMEEAASYGDTVVNGQLDRAYADLLCAIQRQLPGTFTQEELQEAEVAVAAEQKAADAQSVAETTAEEAAPAAAEPATAVTASDAEAPEAAAAEGAPEAAEPGEAASKAAISGTLPVAESALGAGQAGPESAAAPACYAGLIQPHAPTALASSNAESEKGAATHVASLSLQPPPLSPRPDALHSPSPPAAAPMPGSQRSTASPLQVSRAAALVAPGSSRMGSAGSLAPSMASSTAAAGAPIQQYLDSTVVPILREGLRALLDARPGDPLQYLADYLLAARASKRAAQIA